MKLTLTELNKGIQEFYEQNSYTLNRIHDSLGCTKSMHFNEYYIEFSTVDKIFPYRVFHNDKFIKKLCNS